jgi:ketosteroid isomerase-like protein
MGWAIAFALPTFAQKKKTIDPEARQQIEALSTKFVEAYNKHDADAIAALLTPDAVEVRSWRTSVGGGTFSGLQSLEGMFAADFVSSPGKMVNEHVQMYPIGNDVCTIIDMSVGEWKGHVVTIYTRASDTGKPWKIRMSYVNAF